MFIKHRYVIIISVFFKHFLFKSQDTKEITQDNKYVAMFFCVN